MTDLEQAHLVELIALARGRGVPDAEIAAMLLAEAERLHASRQTPAPQIEHQ